MLQNKYPNTIFKFVFILIIFFSNTSWSEQSTENLDKKHQTSEKFLQHFEADLNTLYDALNQELYNDSLEITERIQDKIILYHRENIASFFPKTFKKWKIKTNKKNYENEFGNNDFGVVFTQTYSNAKGHSIEVNIVDAEESIKDYQDLIKNPTLIENMSDTSLIDSNGYQTIKRNDKESNHNEHNIILKNNLLLTLISTGSSNESLLNKYFEKVDIEGLERYLQN